MGVSRRTILELAGGTGLVVAGGLAGYGGGKLMSGERDAVAGFEWSDGRFPPFRNDDLIGVSPFFEGDSDAGLQRYDRSRTVAIIGTSATEAVSHLAQPGTRLGFAYTDPGGEWHQGAGEEGQLYGGIILHEGQVLLAAALGIGRGDVRMTWTAQRDGLVTPLNTFEIGVTPRDEFAQQYPGIPQL